MRVVLVDIHATIPALRYGGIERIMWWLGRELSRRGHEVTYLVRAGECPFARVVRHDPLRSIDAQLPAAAELVHVHHDMPDGETIRRPWLRTLHGAGSRAVELDRNTVFISADQARRFGADRFIPNGLDWDDYGEPALDAPRSGLHFLGDGAWSVKNLRGAIRVARLAGEELEVAGGFRLNFRMGFRFTLSPRVHFHGWVDDGKKREILSRSRGLVFPVRWREPFGLAVAESLWYGCPVFATPYGSLLELVPPEVGFLSADASELAEAVRGASRFDPRACHAHARSRFALAPMVDAYEAEYRRVLAGEPVHRVAPRRIAAPDPRLLPFH